MAEQVNVGQVVIVGGITAVVLGVPKIISEIEGPFRLPDGPFLVIGVVAAVLLVVGLVALVVTRAIERRRVLERGEVLHGWIVQANTRLFEEGSFSAPAQVLISFAGKRAASDERLAETARRLASLKGKVLYDAPELKVAELVNDETYRPGVRALLPPWLTNGAEVMSVHVWIDRSLLPGGRLTLPFVRCKALPGPKGRVLMIPNGPTQSGPPGPVA